MKRISCVDHRLSLFSLLEFLCHRVAGFSFCPHHRHHRLRLRLLLHHHRFWLLKIHLANSFRAMPCTFHNLDNIRSTAEKNEMNNVSGSTNGFKWADHKLKNTYLNWHCTIAAVLHCYRICDSIPWTDLQMFQNLGHCRLANPLTHWVQIKRNRMWMLTINSVQIGIFCEENWMCGQRLSDFCIQNLQWIRLYRKMILSQSYSVWHKCQNELCWKRKWQQASEVGCSMLVSWAHFSIQYFIFIFIHFYKNSWWFTIFFSKNFKC